MLILSSLSFLVHLPVSEGTKRSGVSFYGLNIADGALSLVLFIPLLFYVITFFVRTFPVLVDNYTISKTKEINLELEAVEGDIEQAMYDPEEGPYDDREPDQLEALIISARKEASKKVKALKTLSNFAESVAVFSTVLIDFTLPLLFGVFASTLTFKAADFGLVSQLF